jgi:regulator of sirC expression with transglutaminase-like and TPR domain
VTDIDHTTFAREVQRTGGRLSPGRAGLLFAREVAYPDLQPSASLALLDDLAIDAQRALTGPAEPEERGVALADYLFNQAGYQGNAAEYGDPRNSYLNQVLERRLGLPISLSVIFLEVGWRLQLPVSGVGLPGHFIVSVNGADGPVYLDPFHAGRRLTLDDCRDLAVAALGSQAQFEPSWLAPTAPRDIVARMLNNLRAFYVSVEDWTLAIAILACLQALQPDQAEHVRDLGVLHYRNNSFKKASELFNEYLVLRPDAPDAESVRDGRNRLWDELARLN